MTTSDPRATGGTPDDARPTPRADDASEHYWQAARAGRLVLRRCTNCAMLQYPPDVVCTFCQSEELEDAEVSGRGSLYSFAVVDRPFHPGFVAHVPYVVGLVELAEQPGLRMITNVVGCDSTELAVGMPVEVTFEARGETTLPQFCPASAVVGGQG